MMEGQESGSGTDPEPATGRMTPEQAARLLDGLEQQELENLRQKALQQVQSSPQTTEEDW